MISAIAAKYNLSKIAQAALKLLLELFLDLAGEKMLPTYNYWPLAEVSASKPANVSYGFSDGGDFDNTGILGALAQTNVDCIVAFINSEIPISNVDGAYFVDRSLPLLFGSYYPGDTQPYQSYGGMSPAEPMSYVQVFDNSANQLDSLCEGLYNASCGGPNSPSTLGTYSAVFTQTLTTVANPVANIAAARDVSVVWIYNNRVNTWQNLISDKQLLNDLTNGQANQASNGNPSQSGTASGPLANFPYYDTGLQIYLEPEAVNMLAQLSAWNVQQAQSAIAELFTK